MTDGQDCGPLGLGCVAQDWVNSTVGDAIENMAVIDGIYRAAGLAVREPA